MNIAFCTPVHGRFDIAALCMEQRRRVCDELAAQGVEATSVYVGDDKNIDVAREFGFHTLHQTNLELGRKFNDAIEYAVRELEADHILAIGSDDWVLPEYLLTRPGGGEVFSGRYLSVVAPDGRQLACLEHRYTQSINARGYIPWIIPRGLLTATGCRPIVDRRNRGIDACLASGICRAQPRPVFVPVKLDPLQCVDFKNPSTQITPYDRTVKMNHHHTLYDDVWARLATRYPSDLCDRMAKIYASNR